MQLEKWAERRILILGMTYPSYSRKYVENVCTGGLDSETLRMVRLHPIPHRYMEDGSRFHSFQWISARVAQHQSDPRPESLRVEPDSIRVGELIPSTQMQERVRLLRKSPSRVRSVEELQALEKAEGRSLGIVQPKEITGIQLRPKTEEERRDWLKVESFLFRQRSMFATPKPLDFPEVEFVVSWVCDDVTCKGHASGLKKWDLHELYRKLKGDPKRDEKTLEMMRKQLNLKERDVFFFMGSFRRRMYQFGLMDTFSAPIERQRSLFE
jgi:hypothetical protein